MDASVSVPCGRYSAGYDPSCPSKFAIWPSTAAALLFEKGVRSTCVCTSAARAPMPSSAPASAYERIMAARKEV